MAIVFEWDMEKAESNLKKHGISFEESKSVFYDNNGYMFADEIHSILEDRFILIGYSQNNRLLFVSFTERNDNIRIISARKATKQERLNYEKNNKNN
ncbi:MAG: BrnT family toxin [bacterium]